MGNVGLGFIVYIHYAMTGTPYGQWFCESQAEWYVNNCMPNYPSPLDDGEGFDECLRFEFDCLQRP